MAGTVSIWAPTASTGSSNTGDMVTIVGDSANTVSPPNSNRSSLTIVVEKFDCWIRLIPASSSPAVRKGILVNAGEVWELPTSWWKALYSGEVSIINANDDQQPEIYITEL